MSKNIGISIKIIPYYNDNDKLYFLLGNSSNWFEWSTIGGSCNQDEKQQFQCLNREVQEETQLLLNINDIDLTKLKFIKYKIDINHRWFKQINQLIYFLPITDPNIITKKLEKFNTQSHSQFIKNKYKNYKPFFEFRIIKWVEITGEYWFLCIYNLFDYFQTNYNDYVKFSPMFANDLKHSFANFLAVYKNNGEKKTQNLLY